MVLIVNSDYFLKQRYPFDILMMKCCVLFQARTEFLNTI
jgi:hypothetical protein